MLNNAKPQEPSYLFSLKGYYKIWFSRTPDQFLLMEEQLRFIRLREDNPTQILHFIYSETTLSDRALEDLHKFCFKYNIIPVAFEDLESILEHEQDIALYEIARQEITNCVNGTEGNMASASDCVRLLVPVIVHYGIYSDFDVHLCLSRINASFIRLLGPFLLPAEILPLDPRVALLSTNSDFLAFSLDPERLGHLSKEALDAIRRVQKIIIEKYQAPFGAQILDLNVKAARNFPELEAQFSEFHRRYPNNPTVYDFRSYVKELPEETRVFLTRLSVINLSGPATYLHFFSSALPEGVSRAPLLIPYQEKKWHPFVHLYEQCSTDFYLSIDEAVLSKNSARKALKSKDKEQEFAEFSWTSEGMENKQKREQQMLCSALKIQGFWRRHQPPKEEAKSPNTLSACCGPIR